MNHTPTPWKLSDRSKSVFVSEKGNVIGSTNGSAFALSTDYANAARIVECVNAFDGIENPAQFIAVAKQYPEFENNLRDGMAELDRQTTHYRRVLANVEIERDELLSALKQLAEAYEATIEEEYGGTNKRPDCTELANAKQLLTKYTI